MPAVLEPVADLCGGETRGLCQFPLLGWVRVRVLEVPLPEQRPSAFLEAVRLLLAVPYGPWQRELLAHPVFVHGTQGPATQLLGLLVVSLEPHSLQLGVRAPGEPVALQDPVELAEVARVEGHQGPGPEYSLALVQFRAVRVRHGQGPEETAQSFHVPTLLQGLADCRHLTHGEVECRQHKHRYLL